ncbi:MAG TPA: winged helix-turn-helix domain-containing protein [Nitrososphaeraceae archaeon]|jgi:predicted transcriptional regulator|nr:winged helix-turn-helix domain-containing protein [Nitrososphaeraceae archaeon]
MQYRDRAEIIRQILDIANGVEDATKTKIMYRAFLSYNQLKDYLALLNESDLIRHDSITHTYKTTEKGLRLLQFYNQLDDMTKKASQPQPRQQQPSSAAQ